MNRLLTAMNRLLTAMDRLLTAMNRLLTFKESYQMENRTKWTTSTNLDQKLNNYIES